MSITCGWCGEDLGNWEEDHRCKRSEQVMRAVQTGDVSELADATDVPDGGDE